MFFQVNVIKRQRGKGAEGVFKIILIRCLTDSPWNISSVKREVKRRLMNRTQIEGSMAEGFDASETGL